MSTTTTHHRGGDRSLSDRPANRHRRCRGAVVPRCVRDLRPWQRHQPRSGAARGRRRDADVARSERTGHGAGRCRFRQGREPPADHGGHVVDRARRTQHGHRRGRRSRQPFARAVPRRRHVCQPPARPGLAAGRALRGSDHHGQRRVQICQPVLGSHHAPRADHPLAAACSCSHAQPGRLRARCVGPAARRTGRGLRLPRRVLRHDDPSHPASASRPRPTVACRRGTEGGTAAADHRRRGSPLFAAPLPSLRRSPSLTTFLWSRPLPAGPACPLPTR